MGLNTWIFSYLACREGDVEGRMNNNFFLMKMAIWAGGQKKVKNTNFIFYSKSLLFDVGRRDKKYSPNG
jgi:hypothetical protein